MATILVLASIKGYKKCHLKRSNSSTDPKKNRNSISSLVIPSVKSAYICPSNEDSQQLPQYEETVQEQPPKYVVDSTSAPTRPPPPKPVMLGLTLCTSPTPSSELEDEDYPGERFTATDETISQPLSPAPLSIVKKGSSPVMLIDEGIELNLPPSESERNHYSPRESSYLVASESAEESLDLEVPPIPPKSPARKLRATSKLAA